MGMKTLMGSCLLGWLALQAAEPDFPDEHWLVATPEAVGLDAVLLDQAREYALSGGGAGYITRRGKLVVTWGDPRQRYDLKSTTKSFGAAALGLAVKDGKIGLHDLASTFHPTLGVPPEENAATGWLGKITIFHLASQTAGFEKPGGYTRLLFEPGTRWDYSDSGPNWLAECITLVYGRDLEDWMFERLFTPIGIGRADLTWRRNSYRPEQLDGRKRREFGAGIHANVDAMARFGLLHLRDGMWNGREILTREFIRAARSVPRETRGLPVLKPDEYGDASNHYGLLWWNNADGTLPKVPRDAYWSWGLHDSLIVVIPSLEIVVARAGQSWKRAKGATHYEVLRPFFEPIVAAANKDASSVRSESAPYPPSPVIAGISWEPAAGIVRRAEGSDNWPLTWADDDALYTAYGDGWGFEPRVPAKLSLGFAKITGGPADFTGINIRSPIEQTGDGARGPKASGILMVEDVTYLWLRNTGNSQLAWSGDYGETWTWAGWKFTNSFGCPTFLNFGRNYAGARDEFVYVYSPDCESAYQRADRMVLARVPAARVTDRTAYEFFQSLDSHGQPVWAGDIHRRGAVFADPGNCYRSTVSYNAGLKRYLWCQTGRGEDARFKGGLAIYDAPDPWGPWTTVFYTDEWDVGPGESSGFPTKWMSEDGATLHLVFSGDDCFSVRKATLTLR